MITLTQPAQIGYAPTCGQCKFFDAARGMCEGKNVAWEYDRSAAVRPYVNSTDEVCDKYSERFPF